MYKAIVDLFIYDTGRHPEYVHNTDMLQGNQWRSSVGPNSLHRPSRADLVLLGRDIQAPTRDVAHHQVIHHHSFAVPFLLVDCRVCGRDGIVLIGADLIQQCGQDHTWRALSGNHVRHFCPTDDHSSTLPANHCIRKHRRIVRWYIKHDIVQGNAADVLPTYLVLISRYQD